MRLAALSLLVPTLALGQGQVGASVQTSALLVGGPTAAAGAAFYVRPDGGVVVLANDQSTTVTEGLQAFDISGRFIEARSNGSQLAVDVRYGFGFGTKGDVILVVDSFGTISLCGPNDSLLLGPLANDGSSTVPTNHNASSGALGWHQDTLSAYVGANDGTLQQWSVTPVSATSVNIIKVGTVAAGSGNAILAMVADEQTDTLFLSIDSLGLATLPMQIDGGLGQLKLLNAGVSSPPSGLSLYLQSDGGAILLASDRTNGVIEAFDRKGGLKGTFQIVTDGGIQGVTGPVGNAVLMTNAGPAFPQGVFAVVDANDSAGPFVKLVPWQKIAATFSPALPVDTAFDIRKLPHSATVPVMMACDAGSSDGGDDGGTDAGNGCGGTGGGGGTSGSGGGTGGSGAGGNHNPPTDGMPYVDHHCGCDGEGGAMLGALWLLGLALRRKLS